MHKRRIKKYNLIFLLLAPLMLFCLMGALVSLYNNITAADDYFEIVGGEGNHISVDEVATSIPITRTDKGNINSCDLIYYNDTDGWKYMNVEFDGDTKKVVENITFYRAVVVPHYDYNVFVTSAYDMEILNYEQLYNGNAGDYVTGSGLTARGEFANLYVLNDITLTRDLVLNYPFYMDLLGNNINAEGEYNVTFSHNEVGEYRIDDTFGSGKIGNLTCALTRGSMYYKGELQTKADLLTVAANYAANYIPSYICGDVTLPLQYFGTGVKFSYEIVEGEVSSSILNTERATDNRYLVVKITATSGSERQTAEKKCTVVGTSFNSEWDYFNYILGEKLQKVYGAVKVTDGDEVASGVIANRSPLDISYLFSSDGYASAFDKIEDIAFDGAFTYDGQTLTPVISAGQSTLTVSAGGESCKYLIPRSQDADIINWLDGKIATPTFGTNASTVFLPVNGDSRIIVGSDTLACDNDIKLTYTFLVDGDAKEGADDIAFLTFSSDSGALTMDSDKYTNEELTIRLTVKIGENSYFIDKQVVVSYGTFGGSVTSFQNATLAYLNSYTLSKFTHSVSGMYISMQITSASADGATLSAVDSYVESAYGKFFEVNNSSSDGANSYTVTVTPECAPTCDVTIYVTIYMYNSAAEKEEDAGNYTAAKAERDGYFIIPGVLICGENREFTSKEFYLAITGCTDPEKVNGKLVDGEQTSDKGYGVFLVNDSAGGYTCYLLASGAPAAVNKFEYSLTAGEDGTLSPLDLTGINYLTGTKEFAFTDCDILSAQPFYSFTEANNSVEKLTLKNCALTDAKLWSGGKSYLSRLNRLKECDLSYNGLTSFGGGIVYRTVTKLDLSHNSLGDMSGLSVLTNLKTLDISYNKLADFSPLTQLSALGEVRLYKNTVAYKDGDGNSYADYYGTNGSLNVRVYVALGDMGVNVYCYSDEAPITFGGTGDNNITDMQQELARALNAVAYGTAQSGDIDFAAAIYGNGKTYTITALSVLTISGDIVTAYTLECTQNGTYNEYTAGISSSGIIYFIVSVEDGDTTVCAQYKMTYTA